MGGVVLSGREIMPEHQNIEWKESWRDEYLKWICGFANAQGGRIYIGKNDSGRVVGVKNYSRLLEDIPNKVLQTMGILVDVNLYESGGLFFIEINVAPSSIPINLRGEYHYRSGSTKQVLKGHALNEFLMSKNGLRWDDLPAPGFSAEKLDIESFDIFRREAVRSGRMAPEDLKMGNEDLLDKLGLVTHGGLKNAAVLLFHRNPEKLIPGCYVKIGRFANEYELLFQDEIHGSLFLMADRVVDLLYLKYLTASISYHKDTRVEHYPYPRAAIREIVFNALIHSNWRDCTPIQIRVDDDSLSISNCCVLPLGWTTRTLTVRHKSRPYNPNIANAFFRAGFVEVWGSGISKVQTYCEENGNPPPQFELVGEDMTVTFHKTETVVASAPSLEERFPNLSPLELKILSEIEKDAKVTQTRLGEVLGVPRRSVQRAMQGLSKSGMLLKKKGAGWFVVNTED